MPKSAITFHHHGFEAFCHEQALTDYDALLAVAKSGDTVSESRSTQVTRRQLDNGADERWDIHCKRFLYVRAGSKRSRWPVDKAQIETRNYQLIADCSPFHTPIVLATGSKRGRLRLAESFLITATIPHAHSLDMVLASEAPNLSKTLRNTLSDLMDSLRQMHHAGFIHIDLQLRNILLQPGGSNHYRVYLIDSTRGGRRNSAIRRQHGRLRDLSCLYKGARHSLSASALLRLFLRYRGRRNLRDSDRLLLSTLLADRALKDHDAAP